MISVAIIGLADKGLFNAPAKIETVKDLHTIFGKKSNLVSTAEQIIYEDHKPIAVRLEDDSPTASAYVLDEDDTICMVVDADSPGRVGEATSVEITRGDDTFNLIVFNSGEMVEFWGNLKPEQIDETVNFASKWINISLHKQNLPLSGVVKLSIEGKPTQQVKLESVLRALESIKHLELDFILMPDCNSFDMINDVIGYLEEERPNTVLIIDPPKNYDLVDAYKWCKQIVPSDNVAAVWPWLNYERKKIPSSGSVLAAILKWPHPWRAARVKLAGTSSFEIHHDEIAYISKQEHAINVLDKKNGYLFVDSNIMTLAGNKLSERILLNYIRSEISKLGTDLLTVYDPVSYSFRNNFLESCEYILDQIREGQGINNYDILVNELTQPKLFEVNIEIAIRDSAEIVNICFKFTK